jgi:hypothetical protein
MRMCPPMPGKCSRNGLSAATAGDATSQIVAKIATRM